MDKTPEQLAAEGAAQSTSNSAADKAAADAKKAEDKAKKAAEKAQKDAAKKAEKEAKDAEKKAAADKKKAEKEAKDAEKKAAADKKKADAEAKKAAKVQMPEQNGIRRPKPETLCGRVWAEADALSAQLKQPVPIATLLTACEKHGFNVANVKAEYARWRKFNGVTGRVALPTPAPAANAAAPAPAAQ